VSTLQSENSKTVSNLRLSILEKPELLLAFHTNMESNAKFVVDKMWTNVRFFTTITSALLTISIALYGSAKLQALINLGTHLNSAVFAIIPLLVVVVSFIGIKNLRREYIRFLEWVVVANKLEELLGLNEELRTNIYPQDKYLLPKHFIEKQYESSEKFISESLKRKGTLFYHFKLLHIAYIVISLLIVFMILCPVLGYCVSLIAKICS
jgi:hypothetical protein